MVKPKILIVEDESIVALDLKQSLIKMSYDVLGICASGSAFKKFLNEDVLPDLILMDITIKGNESGIDLAAFVKEKHQIPVIFLSAHSDSKTLELAKETNPYGYINKPFKEVDVNNAVDIALSQFKKTTDLKSKVFQYSSDIEKMDNSLEYLFIKSNSKFIKIFIYKIICIEALKDYVLIVTSDGDHKIHTTMKDILLKLPSSIFTRVHRSFIINLNKVDAIDYLNMNLELQSYQTKIPIGASFKEKVLTHFNLI